MSEIRKRNHRVPPDAQHVLYDFPWLASGLQGLRKNDVVECIVGIVGKVGVGIALNHREPLSHRIVDALARQFDAAAIDTAQLEQAQQLAIATPDVQYAR